jgi:hypothetical protein
MVEYGRVIRVKFMLEINSLVERLKRGSALFAGKSNGMTKHNLYSHCWLPVDSPLPPGTVDGIGACITLTIITRRASFFSQPYYLHYNHP